MTNQQKVKSVHPKASLQSYRNPQGKVTHHIVWAEPFERGMRLSVAPTKVGAWGSAAANAQLIASLDALSPQKS